MKHPSHKLPRQVLLPGTGEPWSRHGGRPSGRDSLAEQDASRGDPPGSGSPPTADVVAHVAVAEPAIPWSVTDPPPRAQDPPGRREPSGAPPGRIMSRGDPPGSGSPPTAQVVAHVALAEPAIPWSVTDPPPRALDPPGRREPSGAPPGRITSRGDPPGSGSPPTAHVVAQVALAEPAIPWSVTDPPPRAQDPPGSGSPPTAQVVAQVALAEPAIPWSVTDPPPRALDPPGREAPSGAPPGRVTSRGDPPGDADIPIHSLSAERPRGTLLVPDRKRCGRKPPEHCKPKSRKIRPWL